MLYILSMHPYRIFCSSRELFDIYSLWVIQLYLLVDFRLHRSCSFVEFRISLALTQVFDDFLSEVTFRVDHRTICVIKCYSSFVEFHISISSAFASKATKMTSYEQHANNNSRMTSL